MKHSKFSIPDFVLVISVGFSDVENPDAKDDAGKTVALYVGDTVIVKEV